MSAEELFRGRPTPVQDHEIDAWLDGALTPDQRDRFAELVRVYTASTRWRRGPREDYVQEDNAAWVAAFEVAAETTS